jgi:exopolysaccharide biosynthesis polyprenyl glycosylphosphotransferase
MTLTTGPVPVAAAVSVALPKERRTRTVRASRTTVLALVLDVLSAAAAVGLVQRVVDVWAPATNALLVAAWPLAVALAGGYGRMGTDTPGIRSRTLLRASVSLAVALWVVVAVAPGVASGTSRELAIATLVLAAAMPAVTVLARSIAAIASPSRPVPVLVVGHGAGVRALLHEAKRCGPRAAFDPVAVCLPEPVGAHDLEQLAEAWPVPVLMGIEDQLVVAVRTHGARAVVAVPGPQVGHTELRRWGAWLQDLGVDLLVSSGLRDVARGRLAFTTLGGADLVHVRPAPLSGMGVRVKGVVDRVAAAGLLVVLGPLLGLLILLIRTDSPGPGFYRQTRVGRHGQLFTVYKLRTMRVDADHVVELLADANESDRDGVLFKIKRDPRITRIGSVLRAYSLDELPQLWNVVRGEMSLVGPRPALPSQVRAYPADVVRRLAVKPGMTGLWQVSGRSDLSWDETVRLDLQYVDNWSWWLDLRIAVRTATAVVGRRGAY